MANKGSEYRKAESGGVTTFEVTPAPAPKFWYAVIFGGVLVLVGLLGVFLLVPMGGLLLWFGWTRDLRPKATRQAASFNVTSDSIEAGSQTFKKNDIHRIILKNSITDKELPMTTYTSDSNVAAGMAFRARSSMVANTLNVEQGGRSTVLA